MATTCAAVKNCLNGVKLRLRCPKKGDLLGYGGMSSNAKSGGSRPSIKKLRDCRHNLCGRNRLV